MNSEHATLERIARDLLTMQAARILRVWIDADKISLSPFGDPDARRRFSWASALSVIEQGALPSDPPRILPEVEAGHVGKLVARPGRKL